MSTPNRIITNNPGISQLPPLDLSVPSGRSLPNLFESESTSQRELLDVNYHTLFSRGTFTFLLNTKKRLTNREIADSLRSSMRHLLQVSSLVNYNIYWPSDNCLCFNHEDADFDIPVRSSPFLPFLHTFVVNIPSCLFDFAIFDSDDQQMIWVLLLNLQRSNKRLCINTSLIECILDHYGLFNQPITIARSIADITSMDYDI